MPGDDARQEEHREPRTVLGIPARAVCLEDVRVDVRVNPEGVVLHVPLVEVVVLDVEVAVGDQAVRDD
jgi:hypothetical protein